ncbi:hypothetical protein HELRODRAFT_84816, partial [Helobdella robusta]|uniref:Protein kinase domain-containing protein n=1 Tax=Helobdella robusta TaxID=6412 RepID=T1G5P0_HELRO
THSYGSLVYMASQIASGLVYLHDKNIIHGALSCKKCLLGPNFLVKIAEFSPAPKATATTTEKILMRLQHDSRPLRWMAMEAAVMNEHSEKSDIWSFSTTLWELLTLARDLPYSSLTDQQVVERYNLNDENRKQIMTSPMTLSRPVMCSSEMYDLMVECWSIDRSKRPNARDVCAFLCQKVAGFRPSGVALDAVVAGFGCSSGGSGSGDVVDLLV